MLTTGMMGALTTFSTFAIESFFLLQKSLYIEALSYMALNLFGSIILAGAGFKLIELFK
jgi:CrcB protein